MDDLTNLFIKKISTLEDTISKGADITAIKDEVIKLRNWLASDRFIQQHKTCQAFLTYLWRHDGRYKARRGFVSFIKCKLGFADINVTEATIDGQKVRFEKYLPWSLSYGSCSQKKHQRFLNDLKQYALDKYHVDFDGWLNEYSAFPELV